MANEVEQIKARLDVVDVIGEFVRLKQSGANWKGLCPFHGEKSPSFMVHKGKQIWHCFGCSEGGDIFSFIQKIEKVDFPEALEILARKAGVEIVRHSPAETNQRLKLFKILNLASEFYQQELKKSSSVKAQEYIKARQINDESLATFSVGYAPVEWDKLINFLRKLSFSLEEIIAAGLALKSNRGPGAYDRFRDRLIFPINDSQGRVVGFGGRTLQADAKEAKYINSPQGLIYNKSLILYNLDRAKEFIKEAGFLVLVEGYMDVVGSWQAGVKNVAATSGTALTRDQITLLKRYTNDIRLAFDADLAGQSAADRGIDLALQAELEVKIIKLPFGKDPDECAKKDPAAYQKAVAEAVPIGDYVMATVLTQVDGSTREGKKEAARRLLIAIAKLPDPVERDYYLKKIASELEIDERSLRERFAGLNTTTNQNASGNQSVGALQPIADKHEILSKRFLGLILKSYSLKAGNEAFNTVTPEMIAPTQQELYTLFTLFYNERHRLDLDELKSELINRAELLNNLESIFLQTEDEWGELEDVVLEAELSAAARSLKQHYFALELRRLSAGIASAEKIGNNAELNELLSRFAEISRQVSLL